MGLPNQIEDEHNKIVQCWNYWDYIAVDTGHHIVRVIAWDKANVTDCWFDQIGREWRGVAAHPTSFPVDDDREEHNYGEYKE